jgi:hypothetical protein
MEVPARSLLHCPKDKSKRTPSITAEHINNVGAKLEIKEIPPFILINTRRRSIPSSSTFATFIIKAKEIAHA